jgi:multiple sugar transport system ATP-binding protein
MARIELRNIVKSFGAAQVLKGIDLAVEDGAFLVLVGPSGCGKSTLLRVLAGLEEVDEGDVIIGETRVNDLPPARRGIAMVFQSYALYPHMSVRENMAFGLRLAGTDKAAIDKAVNDAAALLEIEPLLDRRPKALSGGQRQRVAIGRAICRNPEVFLFDEPLSNLDAALRVATRIEIAKLHESMASTTMIYVTHDQVEAMTLADRVVVMNDRVIQQVGPPMEIYDRPANVFVAQFVGSPAMTLLPATLEEGRGKFAKLALGDGTLVETRVERAALPADGALRVGLRPEAVRVGGKGPKAKVELVERLGERTLVYARLSDGQAITAEDEGNSRVKIGDSVPLAIDGAAAHVFGPDGAGYHGKRA